MALERALDRGRFKNAITSRRAVGLGFGKEKEPPLDPVVVAAKSAEVELIRKEAQDRVNKQRADQRRYDDAKLKLQEDTKAKIRAEKELAAEIRRCVEIVCHGHT